MTYLPPFEYIDQRYCRPSVIGKVVGGVGKVSLSEDSFKEMLRLFLRAVVVDEEWYRHIYPDVSRAIEDGLYASAKHHFIENGYFEGRLPFALIVDDDWYLSAYSDVAEGISRGEIVSALEHFNSHGYQEGRLPSAY